MTIIDDRLAAFDAIVLAHGSHHKFTDGVCAMEAAAWLAGEPHSDHPQCVSPVIGAFMRSWNDRLDDDARNRLLKPLIPLTIGTRTTAEDEETRAWMATDWLARELAPGFLRLAGLVGQAETLENLVALTGRDQAVAAQPQIEAVRKDAVAAWAAAGAAAGAAAWDAAWAAAGDAAWDAAWEAARAAAWDAARAAARDAARDAAWEALAPTVTALQDSAVLLVKRMCDVGRTDA